MAEIRAATTEKVTEMIQAHADLLAQHGITAGVHASRPSAGTVNRFYFSTDSGIWARDNGSSWDEVSGLSEAYIDGMIDALIATHAGVPDAHHDNSLDHSNALDHDNSEDHTAPTYDSENKEIVFQIP